MLAPTQQLQQLNIHLLHPVDRAHHVQQVSPKEAVHLSQQDSAHLNQGGVGLSFQRVSLKEIVHLFQPDSVHLNQVVADHLFQQAVNDPEEHQPEDNVHRVADRTLTHHVQPLVAQQVELQVHQHQAQHRQIVSAIKSEKVHIAMKKAGKIRI